MNATRVFAVQCFLLAAIVAAHPAAAAWPHDPNNGNVAVCTAVGEQSQPVSCADGAGGVFVTWSEWRNGANSDIYAQRISTAGLPLWTADGIAVCAATSEQLYPTVVPDGVGGAIISWQDFRGGSDRIYAQRISAAGAALWTANGVAVSGPATAQNPQTVPDGAGGAIVTWQDYRGGGADLYAQRVNAAGVSQWTANGVPVCTDASWQYGPVVAPDGTGGVLVSWYDTRLGTFDPDIYAQRISSGGVPAWLVNGVALCTEGHAQSDPRIVSDGSGGAIISWNDTRAIASDIYAQRVSAVGVTQWTANGVAACTAVNNQLHATLASDGVGGVIITWEDFRNGGTYAIYAQCVSATGVLQWAVDGVALSPASGTQIYPAITSDGAVGAIVTWFDFRDGKDWDIYAQHINATGVLQWTAAGAALCKAIGAQQYPSIAADAAGGAIITWWDMRGGANWDIYAQKIGRYGYLGTPAAEIVSVKDVPGDQGGEVKVSWDASYLEDAPYNLVSYYKIFRSLPPSAAAAAMTRGAQVLSIGNSSSSETGLELFSKSDGTSTTYWEFVASVSVDHLAGYSYPVPTGGDSLAGGNPLTSFMVQARTPGSEHWESEPMNGYSVDNLPPAAPAPLTGQFAAGTARLHWNRNIEADFAGYRLYRGTTVLFTPGPGNLVGAPADTGYTDVAGAPCVYKLTAVDSHGNESAVTTLALSGTLDAGGGVTTPSLSFAAPSPNPACGVAMLDYTLSRAGHVRLAMYDAAGRRVQVLRDGDMPAGAHREHLSLRDEAGRDLASGLYLLHLEAENRVLTRRLVAIR
jgi:hypothetical protein